MKMLKYEETNLLLKHDSKPLLKGIYYIKWANKLRSVIKLVHLNFQVGKLLSDLIGLISNPSNNH